MKKAIQLLMVIGMLMASPVVSAQTKALSKAIKKEYKAKKKELEKGGWEVYGSPRSVDVTLMKFYEKLNENENLTVITGIAGAFNQKSLGRDKAIVNAQQVYARSAATIISGRFISETGSMSDDVEAEFEKFNSTYQGAVMKEIKHELSECFSVIRQVETTANGKPVYEMQTYFIVDNVAAKRVRLNALRECLRESKEFQQYADKLEAYADEEVPVE